MTASRKTAIITGGSSGIGLGIARRLLEHGRNLVLNGRDPERLSRAAASLDQPDRVATLAGSIADPQTGQALVELARTRFGGVDELVNSAGTFAARPFVEVSEDELDGFLLGNLKGTFLTTQAVVRAMADSGGSIVSIGTVLVDHGVTAFPCAAPIVSKGGIHALTVSLAAELAPQGIRVNLVAPGVIRSPLHGGAEVDAFGKLALLDRVGEVDEIADAVLHLLDAGFTTGQILNVDGGFVSGRRN